MVFASDFASDSLLARCIAFQQQNSLARLKYLAAEAAQLLLPSERSASADQRTVAATWGLGRR